MDQRVTRFFWKLRPPGSGKYNSEELNHIIERHARILPSRILGQTFAIGRRPGYEGINWAKGCIRQLSQLVSVRLRRHLPRISVGLPESLVNTRRLMASNPASSEGLSEIPTYQQRPTTSYRIVSLLFRIGWAAVFKPASRTSCAFGASRSFRQSSLKFISNSRIPSKPGSVMLVSWRATVGLPGDLLPFWASNRLNAALMRSRCSGGRSSMRVPGFMGVLSSYHSLVCARSNFLSTVVLWP